MHKGKRAQWYHYGYGETGRAGADAGGAGRTGGHVPLFLRDALSPLKEYDARHGADLARTLYVYIQMGGSIAATADRLFLHRNSVGYRLQRVAEVSGLDPRDPHTRSLLFTALALTDPAFLESTRRPPEGTCREKG